MEEKIRLKTNVKYNIVALVIEYRIYSRNVSKQNRYLFIAGIQPTQQKQHTERRKRKHDFHSNHCLYVQRTNVKCFYFIILIIYCDCEKEKKNKEKMNNKIQTKKNIQSTKKMKKKEYMK